MKLHKPAAAFAAAAITIVIGGTAYAAFNWPAITSVFRSQTRLPSGNRVVAIDTENCHYFDKPDQKSTKEASYYEIKQDSKLTNDQIADMIKGICEENHVHKVAGTVIQPFLKDNQNIQPSGSISRIEQIGDGKITTTPDPQYDLSMRYGGKVTYTLGQEVKAYDGTSPIRVSDIRAGDSVILIARDSRTVGSEGDREDPNHWDDPQFLTILAVIRVPALSGSPDTFDKHLGTDFVRTEPCDTDPSGFCRAYDFTR